MECKIAENIRKVSRLITRFIDVRLRKCGLSYTELYLLSEISKFSNAFSMGEKSLDLGMDRTTLSRNIKTLERNKLIEKRVKYPEDRRMFDKIILSKHGKNCLDKGLTIMKSVNKEIEDVIGSIDHINKILSSISEKIQPLK